MFFTYDLTWLQICRDLDGIDNILSILWILLSWCFIWTVPSELQNIDLTVPFQLVQVCFESFSACNIYGHDQLQIHKMIKPWADLI